MGGNSNKNRSLLIYLTLTLTTLVVFYQVHSFEFVNYDDPIYVYENPNIQAGITLKAVKWAFTTGRTGNWHPLTWLSHTLDWQLFGTNPGGHHLTSVGLHILNTLLLFWLLKQMTGSLWRSAFVAAAFALHPINVESVAWIAERKNVLSAFFWMLTIAAYLFYAKRPGITRYLLTLLTFTLGLMTKPVLVTLPFALLLLDYWPLERFRINRAPEKADRQKSQYVYSKWSIIYRLLLEKIPFFILSAMLSLITFVMQLSVRAVKANIYPLNIRIANMLVSYVKYIGKMVWPARLAVFYPHPFVRAQAIPVWNVLAAASLLLVVSIGVLYMARSRKYLLVGWLWYLGTLLPVIGLVQAGDQAMADRYAYMPFIGLFIMIAWGVPDLLATWKYRKVALGLSALIILSALTICTQLQLCYWRNSITLFWHTVNVTKDNPLAHYNLAHALNDRGWVSEAIIQFKEAMRLEPNHPDPMDMLAWLIATHKETEFYNPDEAVNLAQRACLLTKYKNPAQLDTLAAAYAAAGKFTEAVETAEKALELCQSPEQEPLKEEIKSRLLLYKAGKPYIEK